MHSRGTDVDDSVAGGYGRLHSYTCAVPYAACDYMIYCLTVQKAVKNVLRLWLIWQYTSVIHVSTAVHEIWANHLWKFQWMMINGLLGVSTAELESLSHKPGPIFTKLFFSEIILIVIFMFIFSPGKWLIVVLHIAAMRSGSVCRATKL